MLIKIPVFHGFQTASPKDVEQVVLFIIKGYVDLPGSIDAENPIDKVRAHCEIKEIPGMTGDGLKTE